MEDQKQLNKINTLSIPQNKVFHGNKDKIAEYYLKFPSPTIQLLLFQNQQQSQFPIVGFLIRNLIFIYRWAEKGDIGEGGSRIPNNYTITRRKICGKVVATFWYI